LRGVNFRPGESVTPRRNRLASAVGELQRGQGIVIEPFSNGQAEGQIAELASQFVVLV
jgi:hypothetical protein